MGLESNVYLSKKMKEINRQENEKLTKNHAFFEVNMIGIQCYSIRAKVHKFLPNFRQKSKNLKIWAKLRSEDLDFFLKFRILQSQGLF